MTEWINEDMKEKAKKANLIGYLKEYYPELITQRPNGEYIYTKRTCITFFKGRDGIYRYCDQAKRKKGEEGYCGDGIDFLQKYVGIMSFKEAATELYEFAENQ